MSQAIPTILSTIIAHKQKEVAGRREIMPIELLENIIIEQDDVPRGFFRALQNKQGANQPAIIAEIKKASPSKGIIRERFDPEAIAKSYTVAGAACLSVLTDEQFFQGNDGDLDMARDVSPLPVLRKDFIIDEYQVFEARSIGADCILLIVACLSRDEILHLTRLAYDLGMDVLVEVHSLKELDKIAGLPVRMIGINNRDLETFETNLETTLTLSALIPDDILTVTESGIHTPEDIELLHDAGIRCFLIGEAFMRQDDPGKALQTLFHRIDNF